MGPSGALARTWLRRNVLATVALVVLVALASGAASGAFAAARRSSSALDRFLEFNRPPTLQVYGESIDMAAVKALPEVIGASEGAYGLLTVQGPGGEALPPGVINPFIATVTDGERQFRPHVIEGVEPSSSAGDEAAIDEDAARRLGAGVGDTLRLRFFVPEQVPELYDSGGDFPEPRGDATEVTVTAIVRHPFDLNPTTDAEDIDAVMLASADLHLTEGFWDAHGDRMAAFGGDGDGVELLLAGGADDVPAVKAAIRAMPGGAGVAVEQRNDSLDAIVDARQTVRFESMALLLFGALTALAGVVVVGQAIARQLREELAQRDVLAGIGLTRGDVALASIGRMAVVALGGAIGGIGVAWSTSLVTPIGFGRRAEIEPGAWFDAPVLLGGAACAVVLVVAWSARIGWGTSAVARPARLGFGGRLASRAAWLGAPVPVVTGLSQMTGMPRSGARTPLRSSLGAVVFALAALVAVTVFSTSMHRFIDVPDEHGWTWDLIAGDTDDDKVQEHGHELLAANDDVDGFAAVWIGYEDFVSAEGVRDLAVAGVETVAGDTYVALTEGRGAVQPDEIVLGQRTMTEAGVEIGDELVLTGPRAPVTFEVVGTAVLHELAAGGFELDEGAIVTPTGLGQLFTGNDVRVGDSDFADGTLLARFLIDVADGVSLDAATASLKRDFGPTVIPHLPPLDVAGLDSTRSLPVAFAALVAMLGTASLVHLLLVTVRRRCREFAVLATLGASRRQLASTVASLATALGSVAVLVGVPAGLVVGRLGWRVLADGIGAPTPPAVPTLMLLAVVVAVLVVANVVAAVPARAARRLRPADVLRSQ